MQLIFKDKYLSRIEYLDQDHDRVDGMISLIINKLAHKIMPYKNVVIAYPTNVEEFATYYICNQLCALRNKNLILFTRNPFAHSARVDRTLKKRYFLSTIPKADTIYISASMLHSCEISERIRETFPCHSLLVFHDYLTAVLIADTYGLDYKLVTHDDIVGYKDFYSYQEVVHFNEV